MRAEAEGQEEEGAVWAVEKERRWCEGVKADGGGGGMDGYGGGRWGEGKCVLVIEQFGR